MCARQDNMISVVIPVYNVEKYLRECIDSVLNQSYQNYEVILVDDGSTDSSGLICDEYEKIDNRIKVIHKENRGLSEARNTGLDAAKGDYIYFLDSDDYIRNDMLEKIVAVVNQKEYDIVYFEAEVFYEQEKLFSSEISYNRKKNYGVMPGETAVRQLFSDDSYYTAVPLHLFRRTFLNNNNLRFYPNILHEDNLFTSLAFVRAQITIHIHDKFYYRRMRNGSIMTTAFNEKNFHGYYVCLEELIKELKEHRDTSDSYIFLKEFIINRSMMIIEEYALLPLAKRMPMKKDLSNIRKAFKEQNYFNKRMLKIKMNIIPVYFLYLRLRRILKKQ